MQNHNAYSSSITFLRDKMLSEKAAEELINSLDDRILKMKAHKDIAEFLNEVYKLRKTPNVDVHYLGTIQDFFNYVKLLIEDEEWVSVKNQKVAGKKHLLNIPTKATLEEILDFWLKLQGNNEKGEPYWENKDEIEHFVNQNFEVFPGVNEIKVFNPNMSKSEFNHVTWTFYHNYGMSKTKKQYEKLLMQNFTKFKDGSNVYSNIKDQSNEHLKRLFK